MYATERQGLIERMLVEEGRVAVVELAERFGVTTETVRRDLDALEQAGALRRVHGGAVALERASTAEASVLERTALRADTKQRIAARALDVLGDAFTGSLYFDAGTTTAAVALASRRTPGHDDGPWRCAVPRDAVPREDETLRRFAGRQPGYGTPTSKSPACRLSNGMSIVACASGRLPSLPSTSCAHGLRTRIIISPVSSSRQTASTM